VIATAAGCFTRREATSGLDALGAHLVLACAKTCDQAGDSELAELCHRCAVSCRKPHGLPA